MELDLIGAALGVDVRPFPFEIPIPPDRLPPAASPSPELLRLVRTFGRGRIAVVLLGSSRRRSYRVRGVIGTPTAVVAVQRGEVVRFTAARPESLVRQVVGQLPPMRPGPGGSITIRPAEPTESYLEAVCSPRSQADHILSRPRLGSGYVTVTASGHEPLTVSWLDTDAGRYAAIPDDRSYVTYTPADVRKLEQIVSRFVSRLT